tara:strand:- start:1102 stop:1314 length:213 start_codon:yes stop_codon:yes gene_type:complete
MSNKLSKLSKKSYNNQWKLYYKSENKKLKQKINKINLELQKILTYNRITKLKRQLLGNQGLKLLQLFIYT